MKLNLWITGLMFSCLNGFAQVRIHTDVRTPTWNLIGLRYDAALSPGKWGSIYPPALKRLNRKIIELPGYIIPTKVGIRFSEFMFAMVPVASCPYCGSGDIPSMIAVKMLKPIAITEKAVKLRGLLVINDSGDDRSEFFLLQSKLIP